MNNDNKTPKQDEPVSMAADLLDWLRSLSSFLIGFVLFFTFIGMIITVSGSSMYPTLHDRDVMLVQRIGYTPAQGDIIVVKKPSFMDEAIVKRCIAVAGQEVEIDYDENAVYVDGVALEEDYLNFTNEGIEERGYGDDWMVQRPGMVNDHFIVPEDCIFVMGDNRNGSTDSRYGALGMVETQYVIGHVLGVVFPFGDAKLLN